MFEKSAKNILIERNGSARNGKKQEMEEMAKNKKKKKKKKQQEMAKNILIERNVCDTFRPNKLAHNVSQCRQFWKPF